MRIACPILCTERPIFLSMVSLVILMRSIILGIYKNNVDAQLRLLLLDLPGNFE